MALKGPEIPYNRTIGDEMTTPRSAVAPDGLPVPTWHDGFLGAKLAQSCGSALMEGRASPANLSSRNVAPQVDCPYYHFSQGSHFILIRTEH
jgi:hypothetical protein